MKTVTLTLSTDDGSVGTITRASDGTVTCSPTLQTLVDVTVQRLDGDTIAAFDELARYNNGYLWVSEVTVVERG